MMKSNITTSLTAREEEQAIIGAEYHKQASFGRYATYELTACKSFFKFYSQEKALDGGQRLRETAKLPVQQFIDKGARLATLFRVDQESCAAGLSVEAASKFIDFMKEVDFSKL
jgi:hypothetical protein